MQTAKSPQLMRGPLGSRYARLMQQPRHNVTRALFLGVGLTAITLIVLTSLSPKNYFFYRLEDRDKWTYPLAGVALVVGLIVLETAFTYLVFMARRPRPLSLRALLGLLVLGPWGCFVAMWVVHAPMFYLLHIVYVWLLIAIIAFALLISVAYSGGRWFRAQAPRQT